MKGKEKHSAITCDEISRNGGEKSSVWEQWKRLADAFPAEALRS